MPNLKERTLILLKPDALQRGFLGEVIGRFERKGFKIVGLKMTKPAEAIWDEHYGAHKDKPFFGKLKGFMSSGPLVAIAIEGLEAVSVIRKMTGSTSGREALPGTIRGDFSISGQANIIHASGTVDEANDEIYRFFNEDELFDYTKPEFEWIYSDEERE